MNIRKISLVLILATMSAFITNAVTEIWVSPNGLDINEGTKENPFRSLTMALRKAREMRRLNDPAIQGGIHIYLNGLYYFLDEPVLIRPEDSGTETSPTIIEAAPGENPLISGGIQITNWKKATGNIPGLPKEAKGEIWVADVPKIGGRIPEFRQLWINDKKTIRANTINDGPLERILSVNKILEEMWIPTPKIKVTDPTKLEFVIHQWWAIAILRVKSLDTYGNKTRITFCQPESRIEFEHPWPAPFIDEEKNLNGNSAFFFANAIEFLNSPGEWYLDLEKGKIYYWPRLGEIMDFAIAIAPVLENILQIEGTLDNTVKHIYFKNLHFEHSGWLRPSKAGHVPLQAGMYILDAYKLKTPGTPDKVGLENQAWIGRQSAGVSVKNASHIVFERCFFRHMAATGLDFISGTSYNKVEGCIFNDIGGTAIQMGFFGNEGFESHLPYNPSDEREVCRFETIANNLITDCTNEDWGCVGISVGYAHDITIEHNELHDLNYSGICVGWGWTKTITCMKNNRIFANKIHHFAKNMYDVGGIYTLSAQPNTEIKWNYIFDLVKAPYAHIPEHYQYIYLDEGSSYIRVTENYTEKEKFFSNSPGPGNEWKENGPDVPDEVKNAAGLKPEFIDLWNFIK